MQKVYEDEDEADDLQDEKAEEAERHARKEQKHAAAPKIMDEVRLEIIGLANQTLNSRAAPRMRRGSTPPRLSPWTRGATGIFGLAFQILNSCGAPYTPLRPSPWTRGADTVTAAGSWPTSSTLHPFA